MYAAPCWCAQPANALSIPFYAPCRCTHPLAACKNRLARSLLQETDNCKGAWVNRILIIDDARERAAWLKASLDLAGYEVMDVLTWVDIDAVRLQRLHPDVVIVDGNAPGRAMLEQISAMSAALELPVVVLGGHDDQDSIREAMRAGVSAYVSHAIQAEDLAPILRVATARFAEYKRLRDELKEAKNQLAERKTIDRAKGILMQEYGFSESEAYQRMRRMAMDRGKRLVEVAELVILAQELKN